MTAHADALPENGGGCNHYPMAAEALTVLGHEDAIDESWIDGAAFYEGELPRFEPIKNVTDGLGSYERVGDLLDYFRGELEHRSWQAVVAHWAPRLAPGIAAAAFHGVIRTGHAARALRHQVTAARKNELAVGLAYWAARYARLPTTKGNDREGLSLRRTLEGLNHPWLNDRDDVGFHEVGNRLSQAETPVAPPLSLVPGSSPSEALQSMVRDAAAGVLEMLVAERHRLWLMHTITGPAAVGLLMPEVREADARTLVAYARQAVVAMFAAYGEPFKSRAHERASPAEWPILMERSIASGSIHTIKLAEALNRYETEGDLLYRSLLEQWLEWV